MQGSQPVGALHELRGRLLRAWQVLVRDPVLSVGVKEVFELLSLLLTDVGHAVATSR